MIKFINSWAQGIILSVIIATIIEIVLPEGNNKKYVKTIIGIFILFTIVYPLLTKISSKNINVNSIINSTNEEIKKYETNTIATLETNSYIENTYKEKLEEDIIKNMSDKGYEVNEVIVDIEIEDEKKYGQINSIAIKIKENDKNNNTNNTANQINQIEIEVNLNKNIEKNNNEISEITDYQKENLKEYLNNIYGVEREKIYIN